MARVTIEEVAARAGVSGATVSKAFRGLRVTDETRERVLVAARELGWAPNPHAASLASGRTATLGLVMAFYGIWYDVEFLNAVNRAARASGFDLLIWPTETLDGPETGEPPIQSFARRVDGLIVADFHAMPGLESSLASLGVAGISVGGRLPGLASVGIDNRAAADMAVSRLVELGHRSIALVTESEAPVGQSPVAAERRDGYRRALQRAGVVPDPGLEIVTDDGPAGGAAAIGPLTALDPAPTAVFCHSDEMAIGLAVAAQRRGLRIPADLSIVGFDDTEMARVMDITSVRQPIEAMAEMAVGRVVSAIREGVDSEAREVLAVELVERGSTAKPRR